MGNIGNIILASVRKRIPISLNGTQYLPANYKFSLKDPYILEALPEGSIDKFVKFENQNLKKVCQTLHCTNRTNRQKRIDTTNSCPNHGKR